MATLSKLFLLCFVMLQFSACGDNDFDKAQELTSYRVIGITADRPEVTPSEPVTVLTLHDFHPADLIGERPPTAYEWRVCLVSVGGFAQYECIDPSLELPLPSTGQTTTLDLAAVVDFIPQERLEQGHSVWVKLTATSGDESVEVVRSVTVSLSETLNQNPTLESFGVVAIVGPDGKLREGTPRAGDTLSLALTMKDGSAEDFIATETVNGDSVEREYTEQLIYTWYSSGGELERARGTDDQRENELTDIEEGPLRIVVGARDGRGGFDIRSLDFDVLPPAN